MRTLSAASLAPLAMAAGLIAVCQEADAQLANDTYALRQEMRNDSYVWEPMLKRAMPGPPRPQLINPGARAARAHTQAAANPTAAAVMNYYRGRRGLAPAPVAAAPRPTVTPAAYAPSDGGQNLPFEDITTRPTVTAYLGLFEEEFDESLPNYYQHVRPRLEQEQTMQRQQRQLERAKRGQQRGQQRGLSIAPRANLSRGASGGSRYGDTGRFYSNWTR